MRRVIAVLLALVMVGSVIGIVIAGNSGFFEFKGQSKVAIGPIREIPSFGPKTLQEIKKKPYVFEAYGKIPEFNTTEQRIQWLGVLEDLAENVRKNHMLDRYFYPNGPVIAYGYDYRGYLRVSFERNSSVNESILDDIYKAFDYHATKKASRMFQLFSCLRVFPLWKHVIVIGAPS